MAIEFPRPLLETDFHNPGAYGLDEQHAFETFFGKSAAQAEAMFRQNFLFYQEDLFYMRAPAFQFYVVPAVQYLLSDASTGDSDAVSTFSHLLEWRLAHDPSSLVPLADALLDAITRLLVHFDRFECCEEIYGDVPGRLKKLAASLSAKIESEH